MRTNHRFLIAGQLSLVLLLLVGAALITAEKPVSTTQDKAFYAGPNLDASVGPGLEVETVSAAICPGRTITASVMFSIPKGLPQERRGIVTPGATDAGWIVGCNDPPGTIKEKFPKKGQGQ